MPSGQKSRALRQLDHFFDRFQFRCFNRSVTGQPGIVAGRDVLQQVGLRVTRPRLAVLGYVEKHPHSTVDDVVSGVRTELRSISTQAVYDILGALSRHGVLRRMEPAGQAARYELAPHDAHQHLVCRECGCIEDVVLSGAPTETRLSDDHGYLVQDTEVTVWGVCPRCQSSSDPTSPDVAFRTSR